MLKKIVLLIVFMMLVGCAGWSKRHSNFRSNRVNSNQAVNETNSSSEVKASKLVNNDISCKVSNYYSVPADTTEFYGDCTDGKAVKGLVLWKEKGIGTHLDCVDTYYRGGYTSFLITADSVCGKYFPLLPSFCKVGDYFGQCKNGQPDGVGIKVISVSAGSAQVDGMNYEILNGQFSNGVPNGYVRKEGKAVYSDYAYWYANGEKIVDCDEKGSAERCRAKAQAEPARLAKGKQEEREHEAMIQRFRKSIQVGTDTSSGVVVDTKGSLVKIQTNESQCTQRDYNDSCKNYVNTPVEKWFKKSEVYPK